MDPPNPFSMKGHGLGMDVFVSVGVPDGIEFEEKFMDSNPKIGGFIVDGTRDIVCRHKRLMHIKQNLSPIKTLRTENLDKFYRGFKDIYLKMNVKGYEAEYFKSLTREQLLKIKVLHIEIHTDPESTVLTIMKNTHTLIKSIPNERYKGIVECIFERK